MHTIQLTPLEQTVLRAIETKQGITIEAFLEASGDAPFQVNAAFAHLKSKRLIQEVSLLPSYQQRQWMFTATAVRHQDVLFTRSAA